MKVATKLRLHIALLLGSLILLVWLGEKNLLKGGLLVLVSFGVILVLVGWVFYWSNQKCENCGHYIYSTAGDDWTKKPFTYLLFDGKCYGCEKIKQSQKLELEDN